MNKGSISCIRELSSFRRPAEIFFPGVVCTVTGRVVGGVVTVAGGSVADTGACCCDIHAAVMRIQKRATEKERVDSFMGDSFPFFTPVFAKISGSLPLCCG
jgi:hypothetical protein